MTSVNKLAWAQILFLRPLFASCWLLNHFFEGWGSKRASQIVGKGSVGFTSVSVESIQVSEDVKLLQPSNGRTI